MGNIVGILAIVLLIFIFWINDLDESFSDEITVYSLKCKAFDKKLKQCSKFTEDTAKTKSYKALINSQTVIGKDANYGAKQIITKGSCVVWDKQNWYCGQKKQYYAMSDGELEFHTSGRKSNHYFFKWSWLINGGWRYYINF